MAITQTSKPDEGHVRVFCASHLDDAGSPADAVFYPGFVPSMVEVENETDRVLWVWRFGNAAATNVATAANGARTLITGGGVSVVGGENVRPAISFAVAQNKQYRIRAVG